MTLKFLCDVELPHSGQVCTCVAFFFVGSMKWSKRYTETLFTSMAEVKAQEVQSLSHTSVHCAATGRHTLEWNSIDLGDQPAVAPCVFV